MAQKFAVFTEDGSIKAFYAEDVPVEIPKEAIPITDTQWRDILEYPDVWKLVDGEIVSVGPPATTPLTRPPPDDRIMSVLEKILERLDKLEGR